MTEVRSLLELPQGAGLPPRAVVEHTLTSGYAYALGLESERLRLQRRLTAVLGSASPAAEATALTGLLRRTDEELAHVRSLLSSLRAHARG